MKFNITSFAWSPLLLPITFGSLFHLAVWGHWVPLLVPNCKMLLMSLLFIINWNKRIDFRLTELAFLSLQVRVLDHNICLIQLNCFHYNLQAFGHCHRHHCSANFKPLSRIC